MAGDGGGAASACLRVRKMAATVTPVTTVVLRVDSKLGFLGLGFLGLGFRDDLIGGGRGLKEVGLGKVMCFEVRRKRVVVGVKERWLRVVVSDSSILVMVVCGGWWVG